MLDSPGLIKSDRPKSISFMSAHSSLVAKRKFCDKEGMRKCWKRKSQDKTCPKKNICFNHEVAYGVNLWLQITMHNTLKVTKGNYTQCLDNNSLCILLRVSSTSWEQKKYKKIYINYKKYKTINDKKESTWTKFSLTILHLHIIWKNKTWRENKVAMTTQ